MLEAGITRCGIRVRRTEIPHCGSATRSAIVTLGRATTLMSEKQRATFFVDREVRKLQDGVEYRYLQCAVGSS